MQILLQFTWEIKKLHFNVHFNEFTFKIWLRHHSIYCYFRTPEGERAVWCVRSAVLARCHSTFPSRPLLTQLGNIYVNDGNRPLTPILRQRQCSLLHDVYWLAWWWLMFNRIEIPGIHSRITLNIQGEQYNMNESNNNQIIMTGDGQLLTSINNHEHQLKKVEMWPSNICIGLNIFVITEQTIEPYLPGY
jgi:hypothetical protein